MNTRTCSVCSESKEFGWYGTRQASGRKVFTEGKEGPLWRGYVCNACHAGAKKREDNREALMSDLELTDPLTHRKCRFCKKALRASRYFTCLTCYSRHFPDALGSYDAEDYGYSVNFGGAHVGKV